MVGVIHEIAIGIAGHVIVLLADVIGPVVAQRVAVAVLEAVSRQHHDGAVHAGDDVEGDHRAARRAVIDVGARLGRLKAQLDLLAWRDEREAAAAERAGRRMEVDIVLEDVARRVLERELDVVAHVADHQRPRDPAVERQRVEHGAVVVDLPPVLGGGELHLDDLRAARGDLLMGRDVGRSDELLLDPREAAHVRRAGRGHDNGSHGGCGTQGAADLQKITPVHLQHGWCLLVGCCLNASHGCARMRIGSSTSHGDDPRALEDIF